MLHRMRSLLIKNRTALINQIRGLLAEYGILLPKSTKKVSEGVGELMGTEDDRLSPLARESFTELQSHLLDLEKRIKEQDARIARHFSKHPVVKTLLEVPGIGILTATALLVALSDPGAFKNGRHFSAWPGLVPCQHSSGGKNVLLGISKRGDTELRTLLIYGGRSVVRTAALQKHPTKRTQWVLDLASRRGFNIACVAVANKNARIAWSLLAKGEAYRPSA
jgi:transposase